MIEVQRQEVEACCGKKLVSLKFNIAIQKEHIKAFTNGGFQYLQAYYDAGILFLDIIGLTASCPFGSNEFQIKCKNKHCQDNISKLEDIIKSL